MKRNMNKWYVLYRVGSAYRVKYVEAMTVESAIKKANVSDIRDLRVCTKSKRLAMELPSCYYYIGD